MRAALNKTMPSLVVQSVVAAPDADDAVGGELLSLSPAAVSLPLSRWEEEGEGEVGAQGCLEAEEACLLSLCSPLVSVHH